ncbi:MAG: acetate--CoA ligase [bacterium]
MTIDSFSDDTEVIAASSAFCRDARYKDPSIYDQANKDPEAFWAKQARQLQWMRPFTQVLDWQTPQAKWFADGTLNVADNCLDVHLATHAKKTAIIWEGEEGESRRLSYLALTMAVNQLANTLKHTFYLNKGDRVTLYMPMVPELAIAVLACARLGVIHSVVFAGFSAKALKERIVDSGSRVLITADAAKRRGQLLPLKQIVDQALRDDDTTIENVLVLGHIGAKSQCQMQADRDYDYYETVQEQSSQIASEEMASEDILFILYTSGTTGKPKGIMHSSGGYLTHAHFSTKAVFDLKDADIFWCTADIGWITGHSYVIYGPLSMGATVVMYEGSPDYPKKDRFWELISKHQVSILYTAPTAIRAFMKWGDHLPKAHDLSSLRLLGTVGEPINPEAWKWYHQHIGQGRCPIVDTWWQTETGGIMISNLSALNPMKPGIAGLPLPGIEAKVLNEKGESVSEGGGYLSLTQPWPSMLRGIWGDEARFRETYWSKFDSYFAGDAAIVDHDGYLKVLGRVDDVLNVSGHRIGTMEVESALVAHPAVAEAAVVGMPDEIKGQAIVAFVILTANQDVYEGIELDLVRAVAEDIGAIAKPKQIVISPDLPKTRSGKIMRRILKSLVAQQELGDCSTLANPDIVDTLQKQLQLQHA